MRKKILSFVMILAIMILPLNFVKAEEYLTASENVSDSETYNHSHFEAGNNVNSKSNVNGLSFVAGNVVDVYGTKEYGFFAGENITVNETIEKDLFAAGNIIKLSNNAKVGRDAYLAGNNITIQSDITGNLFIAGNVITLDGITINGDVNIAAGTLEINDNVTITGTLKVNEDVIIKNEDKLNVGKRESYKSNSNITFEIKTSNIILNIFTIMVTAIVLSLLFPKLFRKIKYDVDASTIGKNLLYGLLALIAVPFISIFAFMVVVGFSVGIMLLLAYVIALMSSTILASTVIGQNIYTKLFKQKDNLYASILIGILLVKLVELIPFVGSFISFLVFLYGLGIIWQLFLDRNK